MKQIVVISGKGGTGKTVTTGALAALAENKIMVDCDVDAANLHLLLDPSIKENHVFQCGHTARIDKEAGAHCGLCRSLCRFGAIDENFVVDPVACEGCGLCAGACPVEAIKMKEEISGEWFVSDTRFGPFVHAKLGVGAENSGKLVSLIKQKGVALAQEQKKDWVIIDGAPGIGCPVIASLSGVDTALVVTEPTLSGKHDATRVIKVARHFGVSVKLLINKFDLNEAMSRDIEEFCDGEDIEVVGRIPFDREITQATVAKKTIMDMPNSKIREILEQIWEKVRV